MTKHLDSLRIQNFRCFKDFTAEKLGDVNLIVGKNNSGKSSVLEAVALYAEDRKQVILKTFGERKHEILSSKDLKELSFVKNFFYNRDITEEGIIISDKDYKKYICIKFGYTSENNVDTFIISLPEKVLGQVGYIPTIRFTDLHKIICDVYFNKDSRLARTPSNQNNFNLAYVGTNDINFNKLSSIADEIQSDEAYKKMIIETLQFIEPSIIDFNFKDKDEEAQVKDRYPRLKLNNGNFVSMKSNGDGIATIFNILINAYNAKDGILLIDEVENGLHFSVQKQVWQVLFELSRTLNMQIFATTHSWDAIESFAHVAKENTDLEGVLMRMGRSALPENENEIIASIYEEEELYNIVQKQRELR